MKSIVRRDTGEDWKAYLKRLMEDQGLVAEDAASLENGPTDKEIRRFDKGRKNKKVSNDDWKSETDPYAPIARMKDGRTHMAYKAENVIDIETEFALAAEFLRRDHNDTDTLADSVMATVENT